MVATPITRHPAFPGRQINWVFRCELPERGHITLRNALGNILYNLYNVFAGKLKDKRREPASFAGKKFFEAFLAQVAVMMSGSQTSRNEFVNTV